MRGEKHGNNYWSQKTFSSQVLKQAIPSWHLWRQSTPNSKIQPSEKNVHLFQSSRSVSCCAWPREQPEHDTEKLLVHLTDSAGPAQQNPAPLELLHLTYCRARGCCETGWASLTNQRVWGHPGEQQRAPYGTTVRDAEEQLCPRSPWDKGSPARNQARGLYSDCAHGHPEKNSPWAHRGCCTPCGNAISLLGLQGHSGCISC